MAVSATPQHHHHRSTTKSTQKPFKSRHASKSALKEKSKGKVETFERGSRKTPHQQVMSKLQRRNQAKQKRITLHKEHAQASSVFASGKSGAPRIVAIIPLSEDVSPAAAVRALNVSVDVTEPVPEEGYVRTQVDRFKQRIIYILRKKDLISALDACRLADYVVFALSPEQEVDTYGELILRSIESQGLSNSIAVVPVSFAISLSMKGTDSFERDLIPSNRRSEGHKSLRPLNRTLHTSSPQSKRYTRWTAVRNAPTLLDLYVQHYQKAFDGEKTEAG